MRTVPEKLAVKVRVELLLAEKTVRQFAREAGIPKQTVFNVLNGVRGWSKGQPSIGWFRVMNAALPYLPKDAAREVRAQIAALTKRGTRR